MILLACRPDQAAALQAALEPQRLGPLSPTGDAAGVPALLQTGPYTALVAEAQLWESPEALQAQLHAVPLPLVVCVPPGLTAEAAQTLQSLPTLQSLLQWDGQTLHGALPPLPAPVPAGSAPSPAAPGPGPQPVSTALPEVPPPPETAPRAEAAPPAGEAAGPRGGGWRCVAVWSLEGGAGKTTLALATAHAGAAAGLPTLVLSLAGPDMVPMYTGLDPRPGLGEWLAEGADGAAMARVLRYDGRVAHITGPPTTAELTAWHLETLHAPDRDLRTLVLQCAQAGHSLVILDLGPSGDIATQALPVAMDLIIPVSCSFRGSMLLACALEQVAEVAQEFRSVTAVLNRLRPGGMPESAFRRQIAHSQLRRQPEHWVLIDDDLPGIQAVHDAGGQPHRTSRTLQAAARVLQQLVYPVPLAPAPGPRRGRRLFRRRRA